MSTTISVTHRGNDRFAIDIRDHEITVDQPRDADGEDTAPTPTELFIAGLASCVAFYARRYCQRHDIDPTGLEVSATFAIGGHPARVETIDVQLTPPRALPDERRAAFLAVASGCTVHKTLQHAPRIDIGLI
jgi:uncharacterized OsmC-like protein